MSTYNMPQAAVLVFCAAAAIFLALKVQTCHSGTDVILLQSVAYFNLLLLLFCAAAAAAAADNCSIR